VSVKFAEEQRAVWTRQIKEGSYLKRVPRTDQVMFGMIVQKAVEDSRRIKRCWDGDEGKGKVFMSWWGGRTADSITPEEIKTKLDENLKPNGRSWSETTVNEYRNALSHIFALAIERHELTRNPAAEVKLYKLENGRHRVMSLAEEARLRLAIRQLFPEKEVEFDLILHTGARRSNYYGIHARGRRTMPPLDWKDVNLDWKLVTFPRSKSGVGYATPLNRVAMSALRILEQRCPDRVRTGPVIRKPSGLELHSCRKWFETCVKKAGIVDLHLHDLRHVFATRLRENRVAWEDLKELLGHDLEKGSMTARYAHASTDRLREDVATLEKYPSSSTPDAILEKCTKSDTGGALEFSRAEAV
jgi:integrase